MSDIYQLNSQLVASPLISLFHLDFTTSLQYSSNPGTSNLYFTNNNGGSITFGGTTYHAMAVDYLTDTTTLNGKIPRIEMTLPTQDPNFKQIINFYRNSIKGSRLTVWFTRKDFLSTPSPVVDQHYEQEVWYVDSFSTMNRETTTMVITIGIGLESKTLIGESLYG